MLVSGFGQFIFWERGSLYIGSAVAPSELHSHHAIQLSIGLQGKVQFKTPSDSAWVEYQGAVIPPDLPHTFQAPGRVLAHIFTEPESQLGRRIIARFGGSRIAALPPELARELGEPLKAAYFSGATDEELVGIARQTPARLLGDEQADKPLDPRIQRALVVVEQRLEEPLTLGEVASHVGLSEGRFRHLFVTQTGVNRALALGYSGAPWTEAAHAANFADSAHLTRTCRRMFGIAPSSIRDAGGTATQAAAG